MTNVIRFHHIGPSMMIMEGSIILLMMVVGWKVYKIDKFKNKNIFFLILFLKLSLYSDFANWMLLAHCVSHEPSNFERALHHYLEYMSITFMNAALKINSKIWMTYILKIKLMG